VWGIGFRSLIRYVFEWVSRHSRAFTPTSVVSTDVDVSCPIFTPKHGTLIFIIQRVTHALSVFILVAQAPYNVTSAAGCSSVNVSFGSGQKGLCFRVGIFVRYDVKPTIVRFGTDVRACVPCEVVCDLPSAPVRLFISGGVTSE